MRIAPLLVALAASSPSALEASAPKRVAILPSIVRGGSDAISTTGIVETIGRALELRPGLDPVTSSELLTGTADPVVTTAERCGADLACISDRVRPSGIQLALRAVINYAVAPPVISLHLVDTASATIVREAFGETEARPEQTFAQMAARLFDDAGYREGGRIRVELTPSDAELIFDRPALRIGADAFLVEEGRLRIEAKKEGYLSAAHDVVVESGAESRVVLGLIEEQESIVSSPWLWVGVGAGVAVIATVAVLLVVRPFPPDSICLSTPQGDGCR